MLRASRNIRTGSAFRSLATVAGVRGQAPLSRFEPDRTVDYVGFLDKLPHLRKM